MTRSLRTVLAFKSYQNQAEVLVRNYVLADPYIPYTSVFGGMIACKLVCLSILSYFLVFINIRYCVIVLSCLTKKDTLCFFSWGENLANKIFMWLQKCSNILNELKYFPHWYIYLSFSETSLTVNHSLALRQIYDMTQIISMFYFRSYNGLTKIQRIEWNNRLDCLPLLFSFILFLWHCADFFIWYYLQWYFNSSRGVYCNHILVFCLLVWTFLWSQFCRANYRKKFASINIYARGKRLHPDISYFTFVFHF